MRAFIRTRSKGRRADFSDMIFYITRGGEAKYVKTSPRLSSVGSAALEMQQLAQKTKVRKPLAHLVFSWPKSDSVTAEQMFASNEKGLVALGLAPLSFQWVCAFHDDSENWHIHTVINRIECDTLRPYPLGMTNLKLSRFCRAEELQNGWAPEKGLYATNADGQIEFNTEILNRKTSAFSPAALDSEVWLGASSFQRWLGATPFAALETSLAEEPTWETFHRTLRQYNLRYEVVKKGAAIYDLDNPRHRAKASHLGRPFGHKQILQRLGPYEPSRETARPLIRYRDLVASGSLTMDWVDDPKIQRLYAEHANVLANWKNSGIHLRTEALAAEGIEARKRLADNKEQGRELRLELLRRELTPGQRRIVLRRGRLLFSARHKELVQENRRKRAAIRATHRPPESLFRKWLTDQVDAGSTEARRALKLIREGQIVGVRAHGIQPIGMVEPAPAAARETRMSDPGYIESSDGLIHDDPRIDLSQGSMQSADGFEHEYDGAAFSLADELPEISLAKEPTPVQTGRSTEWTIAEPTWAEVSAAYRARKVANQSVSYVPLAAELKAANQSALDAREAQGTALPPRDLRSALYDETRKLNIRQVAAHKAQGGDPKSQPKHHESAKELEAAGKTLAAYEANVSRRQESLLGKKYIQAYTAYIKDIPAIEDLWEKQSFRDNERHANLTNAEANRYKDIKNDDSLSRSAQNDARTQTRLETIVNRGKLDQTIQSEHDTLKELEKRYRRPTYGEFLQVARERDPQAQELLDKLVDERAAPPAFDPLSLDEADRVLRALRKTSYVLNEKSGEVTYYFENGRSFIDRGVRLECDHADPQSIRAQLLLVQDRFKNGITIGGTQEYKNVVMHEAARLGITIVNPELQHQYAKELADVATERGARKAERAQEYEAHKSAEPAIHENPATHKAVFEEALKAAVISVAINNGHLVDRFTETGPDLLYGIQGEGWQVAGRRYTILQTPKQDILLQSTASDDSLEYQNLDRAITIESTQATRSGPTERGPSEMTITRQTEAAPTVENDLEPDLTPERDEQPRENLLEQEQAEHRSKGNTRDARSERSGGRQHA